VGVLPLRGNPKSEVRSPKSEITQHATRLTYYALTLAFFVLGLMCKPMLVTVPVVLLLLDVWPLRRLQFSAPITPSRHPVITPLLRLFLEKLPLFMLSAASAAITSLVTSSWEHWRPKASCPSPPPGQRGGLVCPLPREDLLADGSGGALSASRKLAAGPGGRRECRAGGRVGVRRFGVAAAAVSAGRWLWFLVTLLPTIGIIQASSQAWQTGSLMCR